MSTLRLPALVAALSLTTCAIASPARAQTVTTVANTDTIDVALVREIDDARRRGLPAEPLLAKVREGRLKRAPVPRIRSAVAALATRLDSARAALGTDATPPEIGAGADALAAGASTAALRTVRDAGGGRPLAAPLGALAQLVASGVPAPRATAIVLDLLRRNATAAQLLAFGNAVETDATSGVPAEESAQYRLHSFGSAGGSRAAADLTQPAASTPPLVGSSAQPPVKATPPKRRP